MSNVGNAFQQPQNQNLLGGASGLGATGSGFSLPSNFGQYAGAGAGIGALFGGLFGQGGSQGTNPADAANPYMNQIPDMLKQYMNPYMQAGQNAMQPLQAQYMKMMQDPTGMVNQIGAGYQASPGYQFNVDQATKAANQASAAGGMVGSPQEQQQLAGTVSGLANQDYGNYMNRMLGQYNTSMGQGLQGLQGISNQGYNAATGLSNNLANVYGSQAQLAYAGQANMNQMQQAQQAQQAQQDAGIWGGIGSLLGGALSFI